VKFLRSRRTPTHPTLAVQRKAFPTHRALGGLNRPRIQMVEAVPPLQPVILSEANCWFSRLHFRGSGVLSVIADFVN